MSKARNLANLLSSSGDVKTDRLNNVPTYADVTDAASGLMKKDYKIKLEGIERGATADQTKSDITGLGIADNELSNVAALPANVVANLKGDTGPKGDSVSVTVASSGTPSGGTAGDLWFKTI